MESMTKVVARKGEFRAIGQIKELQKYNPASVIEIDLSQNALE